MFQPSYGTMGETKLSGSQPAALRLGPYRELITGDSYGRFTELNRLGRVFTLTTTGAGITIAAVNNTPLAAGTGKPVVGIWNNTTNKVAVILRSRFNTVSGTPPAVAAPVWNFGLAAVITGTKAGTINSNALQSGSGTMTPFMNAALTGSALGIELDIAGGAIFAGAVAANHDQGYLDELAGLIFVPPGAWLGMAAGSAVGTSWLVQASMTWAELDWPLV